MVLVDGGYARVALGKPEHRQTQTHRARANLILQPQDKTASNRRIREENGNTESAAVRSSARTHAVRESLYETLQHSPALINTLERYTPAEPQAPRHTTHL